MTLSLWMCTSCLCMGTITQPHDLLQRMRAESDDLARVAAQVPVHLSRADAEREAALLRTQGRQALASGDTRRHSLLLRNAADRLAFSGHSDLARLLLGDLATESPSALDAGEAWRMLAMLSVRAGDLGTAEREIVQAVDVLALAPDGPTRNLRLRSAEALLLRVLRAAGRHSEVVAVLEGALARDRDTMLATEVALVQVEIARSLSRAGDDPSATGLWEAALAPDSPLRDDSPRELLLAVESIVRDRPLEALSEADVNALLDLWVAPGWAGRAVGLYAGHHLIGAMAALGMESQAYEVGVELCERAERLLRSRPQLDELQRASLSAVIAGIVEAEHFRLAMTSTTVCNIQDRIRHAENFLQEYPRSVNRQWVFDSLTRLRAAR